MFSCSRCDGEGLIEEQENVAVQFGPMIGDGARIDVPLRGLGIHNFYLQVDIRVAANAFRTSEITSQGKLFHR